MYFIGDVSGDEGENQLLGGAEDGTVVSAISTEVELSTMEPPRKKLREGEGQKLYVIVVVWPLRCKPKEFHYTTPSHILENHGSVDLYYGATNQTLGAFSSPQAPCYNFSGYPRVLETSSEYGVVTVQLYMQSCEKRHV